MIAVTYLFTLIELGGAPRRKSGLGFELSLWSIADQTDLTTIKHRLSAALNYKG